MLLSRYFYLNLIFICLSIKFLTCAISPNYYSHKQIYCRFVVSLLTRKLSLKTRNFKFANRRKILSFETRNFEFANSYF